MDFSRLAALAVMICLSGCVSPPKATDFSNDHAPIDAPQVRLGVLGMSCPKCVSNVDLSLMRVPGVTHVAINMRDGLVTADLAETPKPSASQLVKAVEDSGLTLASIEPVRGGTAK